MNIKNLFSGVLNKVKADVSKGVQSAETAVKSAEHAATGWLPAPAKQAVSVANDGFVQPAVHYDQTQKSLEPPVASADRGSVHYQPARGSLGTNQVAPNGIDQGNLGDCYFLSSVASLAKTHPQVLQNAIHANADGTYTVTFHRPEGMGLLPRLGGLGADIQGAALPILDKLGLDRSRTVQVTVDGKLPEGSGGPAYAHPGQKPELWGPIVEKAFAKYWGGYGAIGHGGMPASPLAMLTGAPVRHLDVTDMKPDQVYAALAAGANAGDPMVATTGKGSSQVPGLLGHHCYSVFGATEVGGQKYVILRNPWGSNPAGTDLGDGTFRLPLSEFMKGYSSADIAQMS